MGDADIAPPFDGLVSSPAPLTLCGKLHTPIHFNRGDDEVDYFCGHGSACVSVLLNKNLGVTVICGGGRKEEDQCQRGFPQN